MTTPIQRLRAIRLGGEILNLLRDDENIERDLSKKANAMFSKYPDVSALEEYIRSGKDGLPEAWAEPLLSARDFFLRIAASSSNQQYFTADSAFLRHFPTWLEVVSMSSKSTRFEWLPKPGCYAELSMLPERTKSGKHS